VELVDHTDSSLRQVDPAFIEDGDSVGFGLGFYWPSVAL
jgi:hypothetical protein